MPDELKPLVERIALAMVEWFLQGLKEAGYDFEDDTLLNDCIYGFRQVGTLPTSGLATGPYKRALGKMTQAELDSKRQEANDKVIQNLTESVHSADLWDICADDIASGSMERPTKISTNGMWTIARWITYILRGDLQLGNCAPRAGVLVLSTTTLTPNKIWLANRWTRLKRTTLTSWYKCSGSL